VRGDAVEEHASALARDNRIVLRHRPRRRRVRSDGHRDLASRDRRGAVPELERRVLSAEQRILATESFRSHALRFADVLSSTACLERRLFAALNAGRAAATIRRAAIGG
jgi:hypothetical protein